MSIFNYPTKKSKITITEGKTTSTLPMQYGTVMNSPDWVKKKKRLNTLKKVNAESGKRYEELEWYRKNSKIINSR